MSQSEDSREKPRAPWIISTVILSVLLLVSLVLGAQMLRELRSARDAVLRARREYVPPPDYMSEQQKWRYMRLYHPDPEVRKTAGIILRTMHDEP